MSNKTVGIYCIKSPTDNIYVGQSHDMKRRFSDYRNGKKTTMKQTALYRSFLKYGIDSHKFEILTEFDCDVEQSILDQAEIDKIREFKDSKFVMLNLREGGKSGGKHSEETKKLIREKRKFQITSNETKKKMSESRLKLGFRHSEETKKRIGLANSGVNNARFGKPMLEYTKKRLRESWKPHPKGESNPIYGKKWSEERRQKIKGVNGIWMKGRKLPEETITKITDSNSTPIFQYTISGDFIQKWKSSAEAGRFLGKHSCHISGCCSGRRKTAYGYKWSYTSIWVQK